MVALRQVVQTLPAHLFRGAGADGSHERSHGVPSTRCMSSRATCHTPTTRQLRTRRPSAQRNPSRSSSSTRRGRSTGSGGARQKSQTSPCKYSRPALENPAPAEGPTARHRSQHEPVSARRRNNRSWRTTLTCVASTTSLMEGAPFAPRPPAPAPAVPPAAPPAAPAPAPPAPATAAPPPPPAAGYAAPAGAAPTAPGVAAAPG